MKCSVDTCSMPARSRGWCSMHYERWRRTGELGAPRPVRFVGLDPLERLLARTERVDGCWLYVGRRNGSGYGSIRVNGRTVLAHRLAYELLVGPIPDGKHLDHLCRVRPCVNPQHLEPVSARENLLRGCSPSANNARKTHCINGHPFDECNTRYRQDGDATSRVCRTCEYERTTRRRVGAVT